jgi:gamma-tubulin complex component 4
MIAEVLLMLAGHSSSLFPKDSYTLDGELVGRFSLHPGERQALEALALISFRYRKVKSSCTRLSSSSSRYICALCASLVQILKQEYEALVVDTEAKVLGRDALLVGSGAFVPLSSLLSIFSEWNAPLAALENLMDELQSGKEWKAGPLMDMLLARSKTGVHRVANILSRLCIAVQEVWRSHLSAFLVHGSLSDIEPLATRDYTLVETSLPSCITLVSRESIQYVGRAIGTVKAVKWQKQLPRELAIEHTRLLQTVFPEDQHAFDLVISQIRTDVGEWLWHNVLTREDIDNAVDSL